MRGRIREGEAEGESLGGGRIVRGDCEVKCQENLGDVSFCFQPIPNTIVITYIFTFHYAILVKLFKANLQNTLSESVRRVHQHETQQASRADS